MNAAALCPHCNGEGYVREDGQTLGCSDCRGLGYVIPTDPTNAELDAIVKARASQPCPNCQNPDGSPNTDLLSEEGGCCTCGSVHVDPDYGFCPRCRDHSANEYECERCGKRWGDWMQGKWEIMK